MLVVIVGEETTCTHKIHSLESNDKVEQSSDYNDHHYLGPHFEGSTAGWHWHTSLLYRHQFSLSEIANLFHNASPPARSDVTQLLVVTSSVFFHTLPLTIHLVLQLIEANQKQGATSSLIRWRNLTLFIVLGPVTQLKMDVHWAVSSLEWVQSTRAVMLMST